MMNPISTIVTLSHKQTLSKFTCCWLLKNKQDFYWVAVKVPKDTGRTGSVLEEAGRKSSVWTSLLPEIWVWALRSLCGRIVISKLLPILCASKNGNQTVLWGPRLSDGEKKKAFNGAFICVKGNSILHGKGQTRKPSSSVSSKVKRRQSFQC